MRSQHLPMTREEFELMPRTLGWKYEYWDGQAHISPRQQVVTTTIEVKPYPVNSPCKLRHVKMNDEQQLVSSYISAFGDTIDFCDWEPVKIAASSSENINDFLTGKRGRPLPASHLAVHVQSNDGGECIVGAALIIEKEEEQPLLDIVFVSPEWQRKGVATALVSTAINELYSIGRKILKSHYILGNEASRGWHQRFGFVEEPDLFFERLYYYHARQESRRREKIGDLTEAEREELFSEVGKWKVRVDELEVISEKKDIEKKI